MDVVMEMVTAKTPIAGKIWDAATLEPMVRNENGKRTSSREVPAPAWALGDWSSCMELAA